MGWNEKKRRLERDTGDGRKRRRRGGREEKEREGEGGLVGYLYSYGIWGGVVRGYRGLNIYHLDTDTDTDTLT